MTPDEVVEFPASTPRPAIDLLERLRTLGRGWLNLHPGVPDDLIIPDQSGLFGVFSGKGPYVPVCTWMPAGKRDPEQVGLRHASGAKVTVRLREQGQAVPAQWLVTQDHPRRGLVASLPTGVPASQVIEWLLAVAPLVSVAPLTGWWQAWAFGMPADHGHNE